MSDEYVVTRLPAVQIPESAELDIDMSKKAKKRKLTGSHDNILYKGRPDQDSMWCLAVKNPKTGKFDIVPTDLYAVECEMKDRKEAEIASIKNEGLRHSEQRNALGEAFGTRKAKAALVGRERNRVDAGNLQSLESAISEQIQDQMAALPSNEERMEAIGGSRPIPPFDLKTKNVEEIYKIEDIVSTQELSLIDITAITSMEDSEQLEEILPINSEFIKVQIKSVLEEGVDVQSRLRLLLYLSYLLAVFNKKFTSDKRKLTELLKAPSEQIVDGIIDRYTVAKAGMYGRSKEARFAIDPQRLDKLLCSVFVIMLHINEFSLDIPPLVSELNLKVKHITEIFRALGCKIKSPTVNEANTRGLTPAKAKFYRIAQLTAPLKLPDVVRGKRAQN